MSSRWSFQAATSIVTDARYRSYDHVYDFCFRSKCSATEMEALQCVRMSSQDDWIDQQNFQSIHDIIFGIKSTDLRDELAQNPGAVFIKDAKGRTALDWATARGQVSIMELLLQHGSNPETIDCQGRTTLLHAVDSHNVDAVRIILEAGANPNPIIPQCVFRSPPIVAASAGGLTKVIKLLIEHRANINACSPEGLTALHWAVINRSPECARLLLDNGADLSYATEGRLSPLMTAIQRNSHEVLKLFLNEHNTTSISVSTIAQYADRVTMSILAVSLPVKLALDPSSLETLRDRPDFSRDLESTFRQIVGLIGPHHA